MDTLKTFIFNRFKLFSLLSISMVFSIILLMVRMKLHHSYYLLFLVWNLFLAVIPFAITSFLASQPNLNKLGFSIIFCVWLLFLPNAPYIITDLLHLTRINLDYLWLDILVILSFAFNGLVLFYLSLYDMEKQLKNRVQAWLLTPVLISIIGLSAFGMYLGRYLRYNSWEIINNPVNLFTDILNIIVQPHWEAWIFTLSFSIFLATFYGMLKAIPFQKT